MKKLIVTLFLLVSVGGMGWAAARPQIQLAIRPTPRAAWTA